MITLIDGLIQPFPLCLTFKATDPDIQIVFFLPHKAPENDHAFRDLERNDLLFHEFHPFFTLPRLRTILPQFKKHSVLLISIRFVLHTPNVLPALPTSPPARANLLSYRRRGNTSFSSPRKRASGRV